MGWSPIRNIVDAVSDVGSAIDDAIIAPVVDPIVKAGEQFEDIVREGVDEIDAAIQNPYVQLAAQVFFPQYAPFLDAYATLDSGEELSPSQIASMAAAGYDINTGEPLPADIKKALNTSVALAEGDDPLKVLVSAYGEDFLESSGIKAAGEEGIKKVVGSDAYGLIQDNMDVARVGYDVLVEGKDPLEAITNRYGDEIVGYLGSDDPTVNALGYAGLATAVQLDKGLEPEDALLVGAKEYYDRGGATPDLGTLASTAGFDLAEVNIEAPEFFTNFTNSLGLNPDFAFAEDFVRKYSPYIEDGARYLADLVPSVDLSGVSFGKIKDLGLGIRDLGVELAGNLDYSGTKFRDLDVDFDELPDYGIDVGDVDFDFDFFNLPFGFAQQEPVQQLDDLAVAEATEEDEAGQEQVDIPELLLADFQLKNPLLRG